MSVTYTDIVDAMIEAEKRGVSVDNVVLDSDTINTFLVDDNFTKEDEANAEEHLGEWSIPIESGDDNYILLENGSRISL